MIRKKIMFQFDSSPLWLVVSANFAENYVIYVDLIETYVQIV